MNRFLFFTFTTLFPLFGKAQQASLRNISAVEFQKLIISDRGTLLDVRTSSEFSNGHINSASQLNYYDLGFKQKLLLLPKDQPVYLYCNTGYRSKRAAQILTENGYQKVFNLEHGIMEWNLHNFPVVVEPDAQPDKENKMEPDEFYALIQSDKPVFIDFYAPWCAPCRTMMPMMDSLKNEFKGRINIVKINADASKRLIKQLKMNSVPYLVLYEKGVKLFDHNGLISREELVPYLNGR
jgi:thioredoxin